MSAGRFRFPVPIFAAALACVLVAPVGHAGPTVTLIGDDDRGVVVRELAAREQSPIERRDGVYALLVESAGLTLSSLAPGGGATAMADLLLTTDIGLIVIDSTIGPTPAIREHIIIARQARVPMLAILLTNVAQLHADVPDGADELLALEIQQMRELLSAYDLDGGAAAVYYDAPTPGIVPGISAFGIRASLRALSLFAPRRVRKEDMSQASDIWAAVYLLTQLETDGNAIGLAPDETVTIWSEGAQSTATLRSVSEYKPGDYREMPLAMAAPIKVMEGSRILLVRDERVVGLGDITQVLR